MGMFLRRGLPSLTRLASLEEGTLVKLLENGTPVEFYVAKYDYEPDLNGAGRTLLVRKDCYDERIFDESNNAYADSALDSWLNATYMQLLDTSIQNAIGTTKFYYTPGNGSTKVTTLQRAVFQLSLTELGKSGTYANVEGVALPIASELKVVYMDGSAISQWTRTPYTDGLTFVFYLSEKGSSSRHAGKNSHGSRPAFTLPSNTLVGDDMLIT